MFEKIPSEIFLKKALRNGGDFADLFFESSATTTIVMEDKKIEKIVSGTSAGAGLRVLSDLKTHYGFTNDLSSVSLKTLASTLSGAVSSKTFGGDINLKKQKSSLRFLIKKPPEKIPLKKKVELVRKASLMAWKLDPRIVQVRVTYADTLRQVEMATSTGDYAVSPKTGILFAVRATASDGKEYYRGYEAMGGHLGFELFDEENFEKVVQSAVRRALINLRAMRARGGTMPVVISSEAGGTLVHEAVGHGLEADLSCQGLSVYEGKLGQQIASSLVSVVDDPTLPKKRGSYLFDDEATPAERTLLVENGILKNFLFDRLTALKMNCVSNGHGRRESYAHRPIVRMANTLILPGREDPAEILRSVDQGLFVKMMGGGEVNTVNGDFVFEVVEGYRIEHGKIGEPVRGATLTGNGLAIMQQIDRVGSDLGFSIGTCGEDGQEAPVSDAMPTLRIPEMVVGGIVE